jgi:2-C-methyl-D-erythritol 4-phosphate cytidylyltransferase / 2-C-methyl-D-erythritol 2,4-cyclodiphosphate synthase
VRAGLEALVPFAPDLVLIHDVARPLVSQELIGRVVEALGRADAAAPALPVTDALWRGADGRVTGTRGPRRPLARADAAGLPVRRSSPPTAHHGGGAADDVEVARAAGLDVAIVPGEERNLKITGPEDFARAERLLREAMDIRTGTGFDVHAFGPGDGVVLCGVRCRMTRGSWGIPTPTWGCTR